MRRNIAVTLGKLLENVDVEEVIGGGKVKVSGLTFNSKEVAAGNIFICVSGFKTDGHKFAADAVEAGAVAVVAEKELPDLEVPVVMVKDTRLATAQLAAAFYDYPFKRFKLIGVTGTNGKTTSTYLIKSILESQGKTVGLIGTNQNIIGNEVIPAKHTTPDSIELMQLFKKMADFGADYVVMEVSSHSLALERVAACEFDIAAFTNITQDHLDFHKTMESYTEAKAKLFKMCRAAVVNTDDEHSEAILNATSAEKVLTFGIKNKCDIKADNISLHAEGASFDVFYDDCGYKCKIGIPGEFSVYNALTALGCCIAAGVEPRKAIDALKYAEGVKGRVEVVKTDTDYTVIIDYAHTPDGLLNVITTIRGFAKGRIITVFGCGGDRDRTKRPKMGKIAGELSDFCVVTSDNPRSEEPIDIINDILVGMRETDCEYVVIEKRFEAIEYALDHAEKDDIILLAGKGHETYQILKDRTIDFDEREIVTKLTKTEMN